MRATRLLTVLVVAFSALAAGCTEHRYVVRRDGAPLYRDRGRGEVLARMERLDDGYAGWRRPDDRQSLIEVRYAGRAGFAERKDLRLFSCEDDPWDRARAIHENRREVILEGKDWPAPLQQAIREGRVENGMTREMVQLAWGRPAESTPLEGGAERWSYYRTRREVFEDVRYDWYPYPSFSYGVGWGPCGYGPYHGFGYGVGFGYAPSTYRTTYLTTERRTVTFSAAGTVCGWQSDRF